MLLRGPATFLLCVCALTLCVTSCKPPAEPPGVMHSLSLRTAGVPILCGTQRMVPIAIRTRLNLHRHAIAQRVPGSCRFDLEVPKRSRLSFRVDLAEGGLGQPARQARARIRVRGAGQPELLFEEVLSEDAGPDEGEQTHEVELPEGRISISLELARAGSGGPAAALHWSDLVVHSLDPDFDSKLPWTTEPKRALAPYFWKTGRQEKRAGKRRLLIIGLDGASWELMNPLLAAGELPTLAALQQRGRYGILDSPIVPESAISWTAISTGVSPGKSGVFTFFSPDTPRRAFWHHLGDRDLRSVIVGVPKASPRRSLNGVLIGGWTLSAKQTFSWPAALKPYLLRAGYQPELFNLRNVEYYTSHMSRRTEVVQELLTHIDWDLAFIVYEYSDIVGHGFGLFTDEWKSVYRALDGEISRLLESVDDQTTILLVSDHGWKKYAGSFRLSAWLESRGFGDWRANLPFSGRMVGLSRVGSAPGASAEPLRSGDEEVLARIREGLEAVTIPGSREKLVAELHDPTELFAGPFSASAPGRLMVRLGSDHHPMLGEREGPVFGGPVDHHSDRGIYLIAGPGIEAGPGPARSVFDVTPTVLRHFGISPPQDAEGTSLHPSGTDARLHPIGDLYFDDIEAPGTSLGPRDTKRLEEELRALGYVP